MTVELTKKEVIEKGYIPTDAKKYGYEVSYWGSESAIKEIIPTKCKMADGTTEIIEMWGNKLIKQ
jgi:hypothetical protein